MMIKKIISDFQEEILKTRQLLSIDFIYFIKEKSKKHRIFIRPHDNIFDLEIFFNEKIEHYEICIHDLLNSNLDVFDVKNLLKSELLIIEELIQIQNTDDILSFFSPINMDYNQTGTFQPPASINYKFTLNEKKYIDQQFSVRKKYFKKINRMLIKAFLQIEKEMGKSIKFKKIEFEKIEKILSEFWYLSEIEFFQNNISEKEMSLARHKFFYLYGSTDEKYSKFKSEILSRKEKNRFTDLLNFINSGTVNISEIQSRSTHRLRKTNAKTK